MPDEFDPKTSLLRRIATKREAIRSYVQRAEPRAGRFTWATIVCGGLAGLLTAGPAAGGPTFTKALTQALGTSAESMPAWRLLCAAATLLSFAATVAAAIYKYEDLAVRLSKAQACNTRMEGIETSLELGVLTLPKATELYNQYSTEIPFIS